MLCWKFAKFLKSFLKAQVSFPSIFSSKFISIKHNSSILFLTQTIYTLVKSSLLNPNVWDFGVLGLKLVKFLMSILNWQVSFSSNFVSLFFAMTQNSSVNSKLIHFLLWIKGSHQSPNYFWLSNVICWKFAKFLKSFLKAQVSFPSIFSSKFISIKHNSSILFLTQTIYTLVKSSLLNPNVWDFGVLGLKLVKFLMSILNWQVSFSSNFVSLFFAMTQNSSVNSKLIHFLLWIKGSHQSSNF